MNPKYIVLHHSATADSGTVSWSAIRTYHVRDRGWTDIGYHWGVELIGDHYELIVGRTMDVYGAHCREADMNQQSIGVCLVGNFDVAPPPEAQLKAAVRLMRWLLGVFELPVSRVIGHRDAGAMAGFDWRRGQFKSCPGRLFDTEAFRASLLPFGPAVPIGRR